MRPSTVMLAVTNNVVLNEWIDFAMRLLPTGGKLYLCGLVAVDPDKSLSEGALVAREWREAFRRTANDYKVVHDEVEVYVDYQPLQRVIADTQEKKVDLLVVEWFALDQTIGGMNFEEVLQAVPCDMVLVSGIQDVKISHSVLLALRGGPNLTLGTRVAGALAVEKNITLFHAVDQSKVVPDLDAVMRAMPQITRIVTAVTRMVSGIVREAKEHDIIVMGAGLRQATPTRSDQPNIFQEIYERSQKPLVIIRSAEQAVLQFYPPILVNHQKEHLSTRVDRWFAENTFHSSEFDDLNMLMALKEKQGVTISVVLPALNEEATIENVIRTIKTPLMDQVPLIDEIILIDSDSSDQTVAIAQSCGIPTYIHQHLLVDEMGSYRGKGEALWKSLYVTRGDIVVWLDTDITNIHSRFIYGLLGPLLRNSQVQYVKGFYTRPIEVGGKLQAYGGGRVTELVARPLFNLFYPELSGIVQPLSGEYAGRRAVLEQLPFFTGYGVETGLLVDIIDRFGLDAIAQSDLEVRIHHNQPLLNLSKMSFAILQVFIARLEQRYGIELLDKANRSMKLVVQEPERFALEIAEIGDQERPPMITVPSYGKRF